MSFSGASRIFGSGWGAGLHEVMAVAPQGGTGTVRKLRLAPAPPQIEHRECDYCGFLIEGTRCPTCGAPAPRARSARRLEDEHEALPDPSYWSGR